MNNYCSYGFLLNYLKANGKCKTERPSPESRKNKVRVIAPDTNYDWIGIKYHATIILKFFRNGSIQLNTGGWHTMTTRVHMNEFLPPSIRVWAEKRFTYVTVDGLRYELTDGMMVHPDFKVALPTGIPIPPYTPQSKKKTDTRDKRISRFADKMVQKLFARELPQPDHGDCFYCQFNLNGSPPISTLHPDGSITPGPADPADHIESHLQETYLVPSLLMNAIKSRDGHLSHWDRSVIGYYWKFHDQSPFTSDHKHLKAKLKKILIDYMRDQLGLGRMMNANPVGGF